MDELSDFLTDFKGKILCLYNGADFNMDSQNDLEYYYA
jgi:hypothetical protein